MRRRQEHQVCTSITKCNPPYPALWYFKEKHLAHALTFYSLACSTTMKPQSMQIAVELQIWHGDALKEQLNFKLRLVLNTHLRASGALSRTSQPLLCHGFSTHTCIGEAARTVILCMCVVNLLLSRVMHKILEPPTFGFLFSEVTFMARFGWCLHNSVLCRSSLYFLYGSWGYGGDG